MKTCLHSQDVKFCSTILLPCCNTMYMPQKIFRCLLREFTASCVVLGAVTYSFSELLKISVKARTT